MIPTRQELMHFLLELVTSDKRATSVDITSPEAQVLAQLPQELGFFTERIIELFE